MQRTRPAPRPAEDDLSPPLEAPLPLRALVEEVRAPGAARADVDALLRGLAGPLAEGESARARADVLLELLQDTEVGGLAGSGTRSVRTAALEALLALGYPYALEVPPEVLARLRSGTGADLLDRRSFHVGLALPLLVALVECVFGFLRFPPDGDFGLLFALITGSTLVPTLLAFLGAWGRSPTLNRFGIWPLGLVGLGWLVPGLLLLYNGLALPGLFLLLLSAAHVASAVLLKLPTDDAEDSRAPDGPHP